MGCWWRRRRRRRRAGRGACRRGAGRHACGSAGRTLTALRELLPPPPPPAGASASVVRGRAPGRGAARAAARVARRPGARVRAGRGRGRRMRAGGAAVGSTGRAWRPPCSRQQCIDGSQRVATRWLQPQRRGGAGARRAQRARPAPSARTGRGSAGRLLPPSRRESVYRYQRRQQQGSLRVGLRMHRGGALPTAARRTRRRLRVGRVAARESKVSERTAETEEKLKSGTQKLSLSGFQ